MKDTTLPDTDLTLRPARWADVRQLAVMIADLAQFHGDTAELDSRGLADLLADPASGLHVIVAECDGALVGYAALFAVTQLQFTRRGMEMHHLYVAPTHRKQGIGRALVQKARCVAQDKGCSFIGVSAQAGNIDAQAAYTAMGFQQRAANHVRFRAVVA